MLSLKGDMSNERIGVVVHYSKGFPRKSAGMLSLHSGGKVSIGIVDVFLINYDIKTLCIY